MWDLQPTLLNLTPPTWKLLKVQLINQSWRVLDNANDAEMTLSFESQLVSHGYRGFYCFNPTTIWSGFGYGLAHLFTGDYTGDDASTRQDLLVTVFVSKGGIPVTATSQILYVPTDDSALYSSSSDAFSDWAPPLTRGSNR